MQVVPLSSLAQEVVAAVPREGAHLVTSASRPGYSKLKRRLDRLSGVSGWGFHDLRRTVSSGLARLGVEQFTIDRCLGHTLGGVRGIYNRYGYLAEKLERWSCGVSTCGASLKAGRWLCR